MSSLQEELRNAIRMKGRVAYRNGGPLTENPYFSTEQASQDWREGWLEAQNEMNQGNPT